MCAQGKALSNYFKKVFWFFSILKTSVTESLLILCCAPRTWSMQVTVENNLQMISYFGRSLDCKCCPPVFFLFCFFPLWNLFVLSVSLIIISTRKSHVVPPTCCCLVWASQRLQLSKHSSSAAIYQTYKHCSAWVAAAPQQAALQGQQLCPRASCWGFYGLSPMIFHKLVLLASVILSLEGMRKGCTEL